MTVDPDEGGGTLPVIWSLANLLDFFAAEGKVLTCLWTFLASLERVGSVCAKTVD